MVHDYLFTSPHLSHAADELPKWYFGVEGKPLPFSTIWGGGDVIHLEHLVGITKHMILRVLGNGIFVLFSSPHKKLSLLEVSQCCVVLSAERSSWRMKFQGKLSSPWLKLTLSILMPLQGSSSCSGLSCMLQFMHDLFQLVFADLKIVFAFLAHHFSSLKIIGFIWLYFGTLLKSTGSPCTAHLFSICSFLLTCSFYSTVKS